VRRGAVAEGGALQGIAAVVTCCLQLPRVLADQELENGGVAVAPSSVIKDNSSTVAGDGQQAPLPRVELGLRDHQRVPVAPS